MSTDYIPRKDNDFFRWADNYNNVLTTEYKRLNIPEEVFLSFSAKFTMWRDKYFAAESPATRTPISVTEKNEARKDLEKDIRQINREYILYNRLATESDRERLGLPKYDNPRTPARPPVTIPEFSFDTSTLRCITIHFRDAGSSSRAKPAGVHGVEIKWGLCTEQPLSDTELANSSFSTRTPFTLEFDGHQRGSKLYACLRWENNRGQKGHWSDIESTIVP